MRVSTLILVLGIVLKVDAKQVIRSQRSVCTGEEDGTFKADDAWCYKFFVCYNGDPISQSCGVGSYFNSAELFCLPDTDNICPQPECSVDGEYSPNPSNCSLFYVCFDGQLVEQSCGSGSYFDEVNLYCLPDTENVCPQPECSLNGTFSPHPTNCSVFYVCYDGKLVEQSCGNGSYFDEANLYCLPDTENICPQPECSVNGTFSPHPTNCSLFYVCYDGKLVEQSCGNGSYFDEVNLYCLPDTENICPQPECSVNGTFSPHPTNCSLFYVCYDGNLIEQSCGNGSYFDEVNLYCLPDTNNTCPQPECSVSGALSPHPTNCNAFYVCYDGKLVEQNCGNGSYFDKTNLYCLPDTNNTCPVATCTVEGAYSPHPTECALFYICYNGVLVEQTCGNDSYFDATNLYCLPDTEHTCWPSTPEDCTCVGGYTDGEFVASPDSCYSYYVCSDGDLIEQVCGYGNYFDNTTKRCERDTTGDCWPLDSTSSTSTTSAPCQCPGGYEEGDLIASSDSCSSYFLCRQGVLIEQSCGCGNYFDNTTKSCQPDADGECWPTQPTTCPGGYEEGDLTEDPDSCNSYFVCFQGQLVPGNCGTGNYFDSCSKTCERDTNDTCPTPTTVAGVCPGGYQQGELVDDTNTPSSYFICYQGELVPGDCGIGNYFDTQSSTCMSNKIGQR